MCDGRPAPARSSRRRFITDALKLAAGVGFLQQVGTDQSAAYAAPVVFPPAASNVERARIAYDAMQANFFLDGYDIYRDLRQTHPRLAYPFASNWSFSVAARATLALAMASRDPGHGEALRRLVREGLERYWDPAGSAYNSEPLPPLGIPFGPECFRFYDDNAHDALILLEYGAHSGEAWALDRAKAIFSSFIITGVDADNPVMAGGIRWAQTPDRALRMDRNMISNAPSALLGLSLYQRTGDRHYFDWAIWMIDWCNRYLRDAKDGLYWDKVRSDGTLDYTKWSYNQGFMAAVYTKLYEITREARFLEAAATIARSALTYHRSHTTDGVAGLLNQDPDFNAVFFRYLVRLLGVSGDRALHELVKQAVQAYGDLVWNTPQYHRADHLLAVPCGSTPLRMQAAMVEIYALQVG